MSWSHTITGNADTVMESLQELPAKVEATDRQYGSSDAIMAAHQGEIRTAVTAVAAFIAALPDGFSVSGSLSGHSDGVSSDSVSVNLTGYKAAASA